MPSLSAGTPTSQALLRPTAKYGDAGTPCRLFRRPSVHERRCDTNEGNIRLRLQRPVPTTFEEPREPRHGRGALQPSRRGRSVREPRGAYRVEQVGLGTSGTDRKY